MSIQRHLFVALKYGVITTAVAVVLPNLVPSIGVPAAPIAGTMVLESFAGQVGHRRPAGMGFRFSMDQVASLDHDVFTEQHFKLVYIDARTLIEEFDSLNSGLDINVINLKRTI